MYRIRSSIVALFLAAVPAFAGAPGQSSAPLPKPPAREMPAPNPLPAPVIDLTALGRDRLALPGVSDALLGALAYLENTQIRNRPGKGHCAVDSSDEGDGCRNEIMLNLPFAELLTLDAPPMIKARNRAGEWASYIHFLPKKTGLMGRNLVSLQDSNLFMTAFIAYPLFLFDESFLSAERRSIEPMLDLALKNVLSFKRGDAYNFWAVLPGVDGTAPRTGPFNIPVGMVKTMGRMFLNPRFANFFAMLTKGQKAPPPDWVAACLDRAQNPTGADALFNIPNDTDDTSVAVGFQTLYAKRFPEKKFQPDVAALAQVASFRDSGRVKDDGRDVWRGKGTGAFMTWLKDENQPTFSAPETGVMPLGVNNVDAVVNANAAFALAMTKHRRTSGYRDSLKLLARAIEAKAWPEAGLYYPQNMIFPYAVTRAWRDGGAREPSLDAAMVTLLRQLLDEQDAWARMQPLHPGAFPGGEDRSCELSTALGLISLLNIGRSTAEQAKLAERYDAAVLKSVAYLLRQRRQAPEVYPTTAARF
ncbi:MAG TPA: hypothetical protein PKM25_12290, partial [Candidatus Ozemobacteraceae bacterium]|nr:hypothetical protein [Candidatus Ozemobacteraceae bacterium]